MDISNNMKINVTKADIENGKPTEPACCPIALAIGREIQKGVAVSRQRVAVFGDNKNETKFMDLPARASLFIADFDNGREVKPFSFEINFE